MKLVRTFERGLGDSETGDGARYKWSTLLFVFGPSYCSPVQSAQGKNSKRAKQRSLLQGMPGDLPRSGGLVSPFCSNIARRFLTPLMVVSFAVTAGKKKRKGEQGERKVEKFRSGSECLTEKGKNELVVVFWSVCASEIRSCLALL